MIKFLRNIPFHFKSALQGLLRHSATAFSAISAVSVTLILMSLFMLLTGNIESFTRNIESDFKIHVSIDTIKTEEEIQVIQKEIEKITGVKSVTFSSKMQELELLKEVNPELFGMYDEENNPFRHVFIVEAYEPAFIETISEKLQTIDGLKDPDFGGDGISVMIKFFESIRNGGFIFVAALSLLAIFLISNTIRMTIYARKTEIGIMRNVGAGNAFIRIPFLFEGLMIGFIGSLIPVLLTYFGYTYIFNELGGYFFSSMFIMREIHPFATEICIILMGCGVIVGILGSSMAVSKYLRWKR